HGYHVEKDEVIANKQRSIETLTKEMAEKGAEIQAAAASATNLAAELGKARLEITDVVRKAADHEHELDARVAAAAARAAAEAARRERDLETRVLDAGRNAAERDAALRKQLEGEVRAVEGEVRRRD